MKEYSLRIIGESGFPQVPLSEENLKTLWHKEVENSPKFTPDQEHLAVFFLDHMNKIIGFDVVAGGTSSQVQVLPIQILRPALLIPGCVAIAVAHNHPCGGTCQPSIPDVSFTQNLVKACFSLFLPLIGSFVISEKSITNLKSIIDETLAYEKNIEYINILKNTTLTLNSKEYQ